MPDPSVAVNYVEENSPASRVIQGLPINTAAFLGFAENGPFDPILITSFAQFTENFGGPPKYGFLSYAVRGFFENGGTRCYIRRVPEEMRAGALAAGSPEVMTTGEPFAMSGMAQLAELQSIAGMAPDLLTALESIDEIALLCSPDEDEITGIAGAMVKQCERLRNRLTVLQASRTPMPRVAPPEELQSTFAAQYWPWLRVPGVSGNGTVVVPPGGHIAGAFARNDSEREAAEPTAGVALQGVTGLDHDLSDAQQQTMNTAGVNALRTLPGRGIFLWGGRTTAAPDPEWKNVNVRRYYLYLERSISQGLRWTVFEANGPSLWDTVKRAVNDFLFNEWKSGALQGNKPEDAYFVKCDRSTMTQNDIDNGRLVAQVAFAPVKPAEFVIFRIGLWTANAQKPSL